MPTLASKLKANAKPITGEQHIICNAGAGTGKTWTSIQGMNSWAGEPTEFPPSSEQAAIWGAMSSGRFPNYLTMCAFNTTITNEAKEKLPKRKGWMARTINSAGWGTCRYNLKGIQLNAEKTLDIIGSLTGKNLRELSKDKPGFVGAVSKLTRLCKQNLLDATDEDLNYLTSHHGVEMEEKDVDSIYELVPRVLAESQVRTAEGDFADQLWLPVKLGLKPFQVDFMILDEAQDLNRCQQEYALKAARRLMLVGDVNQAIYGFAGADADSIPRMHGMLKAIGGVSEFPLMVTRRCGQAIVREAQQLVPEYRAHDSNPEGDVLSIKESKFAPKVDSLVLCRVNAPVIGHAFRMLGKKVPVSIVGREFGDELINLIDKMCDHQRGMHSGDLLARVEDYRAAEVEKLQKSRYPSESRIELLSDKVNCIDALSDGCSTGEAIIKTIETLFTKRKQKECIRFSSIHRAKGLESPSVHILRPDLLPHPMASQAWERQQEQNLKYVAITRAINELTYVHQERK